MKISKNHQAAEIKKPQLSSLIKVLKPKVYITHSSNFKTLVQQLTGNGSPVSSPTTPPTPITHNLEHHHHHPRFQEPALDELSMDNSSEGSVPTSSSSFGSVHEIPVDIPFMEEPFNTLYEFPECNNLEPWAFAKDLCSYDNSVGPYDDDDVYVPQEGLSVFDYDICCSYDDDYPIIQY